MRLQCLLLAVASSVLATGAAFTMDSNGVSITAPLSSGQANEK
ncbi:hypothetical protein PI124_g13910 [Phytophthora idaei]|nr:hypothetical protein PI125_g17176 [Phytophthora idaei]KAG3147090.1 hypothetical protein PI126_g13010 [Phytophthora idaei]KAG3241205.1 hypothetical protein PI124_g13910 [Phytophthora idaei]